MVHVLLATVPSRWAAASRLLVEVAAQSVLPDVLHLVLDGYAYGVPIPWYGTLPVREHRTAIPTGPGGRWRVLADVPPEATLVVLDDDQEVHGRDVAEGLVAAVASGGAAAHFGTDPSGWGAVHPAGTPLLSMGAACMAIRAADLAGLGGTLAEIREKCGFDPFGNGGDDEAVVSAHLWRQGTPMRATGPIAVREALGTQAGSQFERRRAASGGRSVFWQREEIRRVTGWPWASVGRT